MAAVISALLIAPSLGILTWDVAPTIASEAGGSVTGAAPGGPVTVRTTSWRAAPAPAGLPHMGMPLRLEWTTTGGDATAVFDVANVGDVTLASQRIALGVDGNAPDPIVLTACVGGVWDATGTTCPASTLALGSDRDGPIVTGVPLSAGERLSVRATTRRRTAAQTQLTVEVVVGRGDVRVATTTIG